MIVVVIVVEDLNTHNITIYIRESKKSCIKQQQKIKNIC